MKIMMNCEILIRQIIQLDAVTRLDIRLVEMLRIMQTEPALSDSAVLVLYIYFSMLDDGNTRIPLDAEKLSKSWIQKWNRICMNKEDLSEIQPLDESVLTGLFKPGIASMRLRENGYRNIICSAEERKANTYVKPLVVDHDDYLYAIKYYDA